MPFLSIHERRSAISESLGMTGRVGSVPGNCMRGGPPPASRSSFTPGNFAACASKRCTRALGVKWAWMSMTKDFIWSRLDSYEALGEDPSPGEGYDRG